MSYLSENIHPKLAWETLGLRRDEARLSDLALPVLAAFAIGLGVGGTAALLLAPQSGRQLRGDLKAQAGRLEHNVRNALPHKRIVEDEHDTSEVYADNGGRSNLA